MASKTSSNVDATSVTTLAGSAADANTVYASGDFNGLGDEAVTLDDTTLAASVLNTLNGNTSGVVNANSVATLTGSAADVDTALSTAGAEISNLGDQDVTLSDTSLAASTLSSLAGQTSAP